MSRSASSSTNENAPSSDGSTADQRALEVVGHLGRGRARVVGREGLAEELGHQVAVGGHQAGQHAGLLGQGGGVGQVAVVAEGEAGPADTAVDRLGVDPVLEPAVE